MNDLCIVHVVNSFDAKLGYTEYYLAKKQKEVGHEVFVVTSDRLKSPPCRKIGLFNEEGVKVFRLPTLFNFSGNALVSINSIKAILTDLDPQIIHLHGALSPFALISILFKDVIGCKIVADVITGKALAKGLSLAIKKSILNLYRITVLPVFFKKIDCFFANSIAAIEWINKNLSIPNTRIRFIPLGADNKLFHFNHFKRNRLRKQLGVTDKDIVAIYTGKILAHKKIDALLFAATPIIKKNNNFKILIVGKGPNGYMTYIKKIINKLKINNNVIIHDFVHRTKLPIFYSASDFAVWPGSPSISIIEAMSTGLPVIIAKSKWTNHLLEYNNGFDYIEDDIKTLRIFIQILFEDDNLRRKMGENCRKLIEEKLNWNNIAMKYLAIYQRMIRKN